MSFLEYVLYVFLRLLCYFYLILNIRVFGFSTILYGIPKIIFKKRLALGNGVRFNQKVFINAAGGVYVGDNVTFSYGVTIVTTGYSSENWSCNKYYRKHVDECVVISENVWLGANVTILPGLEIAEGVIVAAGSLVNKSLTDSNCVYAGVPARRVKKLE